jgi:hypothetical protein
MKTFWLYFAGAPLMGIKMPDPDATPEDVRAAALRYHVSRPRHETDFIPFEWEHCLMLSHVSDSAPVELGVQ